jgi:hypothetical protein
MINDMNFEKDNAFLLSKFEEVNGLIASLKSQSESQKIQILGLVFKIENLESQLKTFKKNNHLLKEENAEFREKLSKENRLIPQSFKLRNKIVKIVTDIENKESTEQQNLQELLSMLIEEIDFCIDQLAK